MSIVVVETVSEVKCRIIPVISKLSVRVEKGPDFVATNFTFFDCNTYRFELL